MKRVYFLLMIMVLSAFGGTVSGNLIFDEGTEADTFLVIVASNFESLDGAFLGPAVYPFNWTIDDALMEADFSDTMQYFAFASRPSGGIIPASGDPGGIYPDSPFNTVDGCATGIDISIEFDGDIVGSVLYDEGFEDVYIQIYDLLPAYLTGDSVIELGPELVDPLDGSFFFESAPTGPKGVQAFKDENGNAEWDSDEPNVYFDNYLMGVLVVGGGMSEEPVLDLNLYGIKTAPKPEEVSMTVFPNPFNSRVRLQYTLDRTDFVQISAWDVSGRKVATLENSSMETGVHFTEWNATDNDGNALSTGTYTIRMTVGDKVVSKNVIIIK